MNLIAIGIFGIMFLFVLGIISNTSDAGLANMQDQMFLMNCPSPIYNGVATGLAIDGFTVNYGITYGAGINGTGSFFECTVTSHLYGVTVASKQYGETAFGFIPTGWLAFVADTMNNGFQKGSAFFTMVGYIISPANFNILGYTIGDIAGIGLVFIIGIYAFCYISIGALIYKLLSPFSGVG